jgi:Uma2 family endonuclease
MADLLDHLGNVDPQRVRLKPTPGTATEKDVIEIERREQRLYELVDGVLVEKVMGFKESALAVWLGFLLQSFLEKHDLGFLAGESGAVRLMPGLVRIPDLSFISWAQVPGHAIPDDPIAGLVPDLAVEVLSKGNTKKEMQGKLRDYFIAGVKLVWFVDDRKRTVQVFTAPDQGTTRTEEDSLDGGTVLPGLTLPVKQIFARVARNKSNEKKKPGRKNGGAVEE